MNCLKKLMINNIKEAKEQQKNLVSQLKFEEIDIARINYVAGCDVSYPRFSKECFSSLVIFKFPEMEIVEKVFHQGKFTFPYVPGYLSFREIPILLPLFEKCKIFPDLLFVDGQGIAHPRRMGIAAHLGILLDLPSIGIAKKKLFGEYAEPGIEQHSFTYLYDENEKIGLCYRNKANTKPLFISPGYKSSLDSILKIMPYISGKYRIPIPTREAHITVNKYRISCKKGE